jgi:hypothetical protein
VNDESPREAIRELPRERARAGFTARVMARIDEPRAGAASARPGWAWAAAAAAAAVLLSAVALGGLRWQAERRAVQRADAARVELAAMQLEHSRLAAELEALRREPGPRPPVVLVGGDDRAELVIDFERMAGRTRPAPSVRRTSGPVAR